MYVVLHGLIKGGVLYKVHVEVFHCCTMVTDGASRFTDSLHIILLSCIRAFYSIEGPSICCEGSKDIVIKMGGYRNDC